MHMQGKPHDARNGDLLESNPGVWHHAVLSSTARPCNDQARQALHHAHGMMCV